LEQVLYLRNYKKIIILKTERLILNGDYKLITELNEFKMSLWVNSFGILNVSTNEEIVPVISTFHLEDYTEEDTMLKVKFSIYPNGAKNYEVVFNLVDSSFIYQNKIYSLSAYKQDFFEE